MTWVLDEIFRGLTDPLLNAPPAEALVVREATTSLAGGNQLGLDAFAFPSSGTPETLAEFVQAYSDVVAVYRCASVNASSISSARLRAYRALDDDEREELPRDHPLSMILRRPNPLMSSRRWVFANQLQKELTGTAFDEVVPVETKRGGIISGGQIWPLAPEKMEIERGDRGEPTGYLYHSQWPPTELAVEKVWSDVFHSPTDDLLGQSPLMASRENVAANREVQRGMTALLRNGMRLSGVLHLDHDATTKQVDSITSVLREMFAGVRHWGKTLVAPGGRKFEALSMTPEDMQADAMIDRNNAAIMKSYGLWPLIFGQVDESATRENATTQLKLYHWLTVLPRAAGLAEEMSEKLLPMLLGEEEARDLFVEFDFSATPIAREFARDDALASKELIEVGVLTPNEVRADLGREPVPWGDVPPSASDMGAIERIYRGGYGTPWRRRAIDDPAVRGAGDGPGLAALLREAATGVREYEGLTKRLTTGTDTEAAT